MAQVLLSAGHSNTDPGVVRNGLREADIAREMRDLVRVRLAEYKILTDVDENLRDTNLPLTEAIKLARGKKIAIEFHVNSGGGTGVETLYGDTWAGRKQIDLAISLSKEIARASGLKARIWHPKQPGAKPDTASARKILGFCRAGGLIIELFFLDNKDDLLKYSAAKSAIAQAIARQIQLALGG